MKCFLLWLSSDLGGVWLFRMHGGKAAFSACPVLFLGGSKGAVLDPPNEMFFAVAELGFRWCLAVSLPEGEA